MKDDPTVPLMIAAWLILIAVPVMRFFGSSHEETKPFALAAIIISVIVYYWRVNRK